MNSNFRAAVVAAKNFLLGANLQSLRLLSEPRRAVSYAGECLFLDRTLNSKRDIPQKPVWEVFAVSEQIPVLIYPEAASQWLCPIASYGVDLIGFMYVGPDRQAKENF
jgi:hypothetical protein